ncbi:MAG: alanine racemase [Candidatus Muiribacterium halophilum]|uniref:Alanine racemase n=1 Tax=Muiribacterium halophilum TaxID=2053465 RepID=A0A2N5ZF54_MUIH1|nr:MAG: alanine racemase [Candidatus Muirbacterium halophilum]
MFPRLLIDRQKILENAVAVSSLLQKKNIDLFFVSKVFCADIKICEKLVSKEFKKIADSRIQNLKRLREHFREQIELLLLRLPMHSEIEQVVTICDMTLVSELSTLRLLDEECRIQRKRLKAILMIDLGDLREGIWPDKLKQYQEEITGFKNVDIIGTGVNLACYGGVIPDKDKMDTLVGLTKEFRKKTGLSLEMISGGNSSSLPLILEDKMPEDINMLRVGEAIVLGRNVIDRSPWPDTHQDTFVFEAQLIEVLDKPSIPIGNIGQDAFGNSPDFKDLGVHKRGILACGRQDIDPDGLIPLENIKVLGASSDHVIVDLKDIGRRIEVGETLRFIPTYGCLLRASTSDYVDKEYIN